MCVISLLAEDMLASQEGLCTMESLPAYFIAANYHKLQGFSYTYLR